MKPEYTERQVREIVDLRTTGWSVKDIAWKLELEPRALQQWLQDEGLAYDEEQSND